jgi:hypothetical protein
MVVHLADERIMLEVLKAGISFFRKLYISNRNARFELKIIFNTMG